MRRTFKDEGIVIRKKNIGESDRILTIFTKNHGKIQAFAKGVRKIHSKKAPHLDLLCRSRIFFTQTRESDIVTEAQSLERFDALKTSLAKAQAGIYLAEILDFLTEEKQPYQNVFDLFVEALRGISSLKDDKIPLILISFKLKLLSVLGFWSANRLRIREKGIFTAAEILRKSSFFQVSHLSIEKKFERELLGELILVIEEISEKRLKTPKISNFL